MRAMDLPFAQRLQSLQLRENQIFLALTILVGIIAGLAAVLFTLSIKVATQLFFGISPSHLRIVLVPTVVSLFTGFLLVKFFPEVRGSGVPQTEASYHLQHGYIPARVPFGKFLTGVLCIGSGHSMGREGPSVQIGAGLASMLGRWFHLSPARVQRLIPVASAAALSAAFNTPVAAVLFALEEIIGDMNAALIGSAVVASVTSVIVERSILGNDPVFHVPPYHLVHPAELLAYAGLGIVGGIVSLAFCKGLLWLRAWFLRLPARSKIFQPAMGGLIIGVMLLFFPQILGVGYEYVDQALNGGLLLRTMFILCLAKLVGTIISYASGNAGGIFAPSLYLGAMAGGTVGVLVHRFAPFPTSDPGAYALVGMGTLFAGIIRAPMTSVFMILEVSGNYSIIVPVILSNAIAYFISRTLQPTPIFDLLSRQDGLDLPSLEEEREVPLLRVEDAMRPPLGQTLTGNMTLAEAQHHVQGSAQEFFLVAMGGDDWSGISRGHLMDMIANSDVPLSRILGARIPYLHPDHPLDTALRLIGEWPLLPVVHRANVQQLLGVVSLDDVMRAYRGAGLHETHAETAQVVP